MYTSISIDFEVFKALTARRTAPDMSENDVLREVFELGPAAPVSEGGAEQEVASLPASSIPGEPWVWKGVSFPHGTEFRAHHGGQAYNARVENGALAFRGKRFKSPSAAAFEITGTSVNGWLFWEAKLPGKNEWTIIGTLRKQTR